ncbi:MAG: hypothetical protein CM1200mP30_04530 [Pseudomonadota bacterium]|nr:MAG: hypothetical protein CM1200mP30_04530 [Pseudomonadota bacterium]
MCYQTGAISAVTFVINNKHEHYIPDLELEEIAERVFKGLKEPGTLPDYVQNTVKSLHQFGLGKTRTGKTI